MKPARILLLAVALVAGGLAAWLATRGDPPAPETVTISEIRQEARKQVLVAARAIGVGERLSATSLEWLDWPEGAIRDDYVTSERHPDAIAEMADAVARFEIFAGEPIREVKLVRADQGYLSAVITEGMRGVSIGVSAESGAGGFIVPNDRVDVVLTRRAPETGDISQTILSNVKVLAIGHRLGQVGATAGSPDSDDPQSQAFSNSTIATLELNPIQAETVINAASVGRLSLVLRSVVDFGEVVDMAQQQRNNQAIRMIRFGREIAVMAGNSEAGGQEPAAAPAAFIPDQISSEAETGPVPPATIPGAPADLQLEMQ